MELHCSRDLAMRLGAIQPDDVAHHKRMRDTDFFLLIRDQDGTALFWQWMTQVPEALRRSS